jgi:hypothetical protein
MAFGWVLGTRNGKILAVNYGPGYGGLNIPWRGRMG